MKEPIEDMISQIYWEGTHRKEMAEEYSKRHKAVMDRFPECAEALAKMHREIREDWLRREGI